MGLPICLSALIQSCRTQLDFRHKCNNGQTAQVAAEICQNKACADLLQQAANFATSTMPPAVSQPPNSEAVQAAAAILASQGSLPPQHSIQHTLSTHELQQRLLQQQQWLLQQQQQQQQPGTMPGLFPLLANMQGQTSAMQHLNMQPAHVYSYNQHRAAMAVPNAPAGYVPRFLPSDSASAYTAQQRASMESVSTSTRPSFDDVSMLSRMYPSSSLDSSFSQHRMSIDDPLHRYSSSSRPSSVSPCLECDGP